MAALRLHKTDSGVGATFPSDVLSELNVGEGDMLAMVRTTDGVLLGPINADFQAEMDAVDQVMRENDAVLRASAK